VHRCRSRGSFARLAGSSVNEMSELSDDRESAVTTLAATIEGSRRPRTLMISHAGGGGVERHLSDLVRLVVADIDVLVLRGFLHGGVELSWHSQGGVAQSIKVGGFGTDTLNDWSKALRDIEFDRVHIHHLHGWSIEILALVDALALPIDVTLHDYFYPCPQYHLVDEHNRYCGEPQIEGCRACVAKRPNPWGLQIDQWRSTTGTLLARAERIIAPTHDVATRTKKYFPSIEPIVLSHPEEIISIPRVVKVAVLGGLSAFKGLATVIEVANIAHRAHPQLAFRLIGHASEPLPTSVTSTGTYDDAELARILAVERPDILWFPSNVPETFSYTLSMAIATSLPIIATDFECFRERLIHYRNAAYVAHDADANTWLAALLSIGDARGQVDGPSSDVRPATDRESYQSHYVQPLLKPHANKSKLPASDALRMLLSTVAKAPEPPEYGLLSLFRIGRYAGHRSSMDAIEMHLQALPEHERQIVGRSVYEQVIVGQKQFEDAYTHTLRAYEQTLSAYKQEQAARVAERSTQDNALEHIGRLEANAKRDADRIKHIEGVLDHMRTSRSWRYTRPFRMAVEWLTHLRSRERDRS
jgi:O-antigen biosynthesis protein